MYNTNNNNNINKITKAEYMNITECPNVYFSKNQGHESAFSKIVLKCLEHSVEFDELVQQTTNIKIKFSCRNDKFVRISTFSTLLCSFCKTSSHRCSVSIFNLFRQ